MSRNHYQWLDENLPTFFHNLGLPMAIETAKGVIRADGDKCHSYERRWAEAGIQFEHGVAIYLLASSYRQYAKQVRETANGWVDPSLWVIGIYDDMKPHLPDAGMSFKPRGMMGCSDVMSLTDWQQAVNNGSIIDSDGVGYWGVEMFESSLPVVFGAKIPRWASHVYWYNK